MRIYTHQCLNCKKQMITEYSHIGTWYLVCEHCKSTHQVTQVYEAGLGMGWYPLELVDNPPREVK